MKRQSIDLNCDMGESFGSYKLGRDEDVLPLISSANIACGFHAGDPHVMRRTVEAAAAAGVRVGAHPGLPDLLGFGRRRMAVTPEDLRDFFVYQIGALKAFVETTGGRLQHVKPHGALSQMSSDEPALAKAMAQATRAIDSNLLWFTPAGVAVSEPRAAGLRVIEEMYADRAYHPNLALVSRKTPGSVIHDPALIRERLIQALMDGTVTTIEGQRVPIVFESISVHGDTDGAVDIIRLVREVCESRGVAICSPG